MFANIYDINIQINPLIISWMQVLRKHFNFSGAHISIYIYVRILTRNI